MSKIQVGLVVAAVICLTLGAWPVSIAALITLVCIPKEQKTEEPKRTIEDLEKENEALRQELADQAVRRAMEKAESREREH